MSGAVVQMSCAALTLLCPPQSSCFIFFGNFEVPLSQLISLLVLWLPRVWILSSFTAPFRSASSVLIPFLSLFFFHSTQLCEGFLAHFEGLRSPAAFSRCSVQMVLHVDFFFFLMCLWEKVSVTSYSSTISILPLHISLWKGR